MMDDGCQLSTQYFFPDCLKQKYYKYYTFYAINYECFKAMSYDDYEKAYQLN